MNIDDWDRTSRRMRLFRRIFGVAFVIVLLIIVAWWCFLAYAAYEIVEAGPEGIGEFLNRILKGMEQGLDR